MHETNSNPTSHEIPKPKTKETQITLAQIKIQHLKVFNVDYDTARRRRRTATVERQAGAPAKGQAAMESQFSVAPSSADVSAHANSASVLSSGRLVTFATALLCGAALLF